MRIIEKLEVKIGDRTVGTLAQTSDAEVAFQYDPKWIREGFAISPFSLPLANDVFIPRDFTFDGVFGVFDDSMPDGWGKLLVDRKLQSEGVDIDAIGPLERLSLVGDNGMGALEYAPTQDGGTFVENYDLDKIAAESAKVYDMEQSDYLDDLYAAGGSSGGARPKITVEIDGSPWIAKFPTSSDSKDVGKREYEYNLCAGECGINVPEVSLLNSNICDGFFASKRFDRYIKATGAQGKIHMVSAGGLLESSHRTPALDYNDLMKLTMLLTRDVEAVKEMFRRMCFNVFAHNRDDHSKNFAYLFDEAEWKWVLAPAYDLTYSTSLGGEHATSVNGNGRDPGEKELVQVAENIGIDIGWAKKELGKIREIVSSMLLDPVESALDQSDNFAESDDRRMTHEEVFPGIRKSVKIRKSGKKEN